MEKSIRFAVLCIMFVCLTPQIGHTCTSIFLDNGTQPVFGYNVDYGSVPGEPLIIVNKRNVSKTALINSFVAGQQPAKWTSKFGSITFNCNQELPSTGMNEAGLTVSGMALDVSEEPEHNSRPYVYSGGQWMQYILDNFSTVEEVIESDLYIRPAAPQELNDLRGLNLMGHFLVGDSNGNCAVIEFLEGERVYYMGENLPYKALTNQTYEQMLVTMTYIDGYGGTLPIPDDPFGASFSWNRFIRAAHMLNIYDGSDPVDYAFETLDYAKNILPGWETEWSFVYDINNLRFYFRTRMNPVIRYCNLSSFDFSCQTPVEFLYVNEDLTGNVSHEFNVLPPEVNQENAEGFYQIMLPQFPPEDVEAVWRYPEEQTFCIPRGDVNEDGCVDRMDYSIIISDIRSPEPHNLTYDLNEDGIVNIADARYLVTLFTNLRGAACD